MLIPAYNGAAFLGECFAGIARAATGLSLETIVADNGSTDGTRGLAGRAAGVRLLAFEKNRGFSAAVNAAARAASGAVLIVLNQDAVPEPGSLRAMYDFLAGRRAIAGGALRNPDGSWQPSCGPFPSLANTLWRLALPKGKRKYYLRMPAAGRAVDWATGAFLGLNRRLFEELGGLDEGFFMYYEDVDLCRRAAAAGAPTFFLPDAAAVHRAPLASRNEPPDWLRRAVRRSQVRYFRKHSSGAEAAAITLINRGYFACKGWRW